MITYANSESHTMTMSLSEELDGPHSQPACRLTHRRRRRSRRDSRTKIDSSPSDDSLTRFPEFIEQAADGTKQQPHSRGQDGCLLSGRCEKKSESPTKPRFPKQRPRTGSHLFCKHSFVDDCRCHTPLRPHDEGDYCQRCWENGCLGPRPLGSEPTS
ncbi:hypothetical protein EDB81DRAFT_777596 [Dactylonectria macrodidyma]|uniref:Uncharacterized protein n=1 Tax=Dactylonectria macrodidyma TaxID=307937 RepID=A0A9P9FRK7_9HYPO|nr:hypothetical protein EDB81DRAFT_777596 [Dactylonectria macrodidyma]